MRDWKLVAATLVVWNLIAFLTMLSDKRRARHNRWRIRENTLLAYAFLFGGIGIWAGMYVFRHKTRTPKFVILVPVAVLCNFLILFRLGTEI